MPNADYIKVPLANTVNVTKIVTILCYDLSPSYKNSGETHDFWEIVYADRGECNFRRGDRLCRLRAGEMVFHKPNEFHSIECDGESGASVFIITFECRSPSMRFFREKQIRIPDELRSLIKRLISESTENFYVSEYPLHTKENAPVGGQQLIRIYLEEMLIRLMRSEDKKSESGGLFTSQESLKNNLVHSICEYLTANLCRRVTLEELSERFHFGKSHLCDVFRKTMGDTILNYHIGLKISEAKRLLKGTKLNVSEIASSLGFESPEYFTRCFKKQTGVSPRAFRDQLLPDATVYLEKDTPLI